MKERTVETKKCMSCNISFDITDKDLEFYEKVSPVFDGKKYSIPSPKLCFDCRQQRRLSFRNERRLYKRNCDATGKQIISIYSPDKKQKVYNPEFWWSDKWNALDYGFEYDFSKTFFEQFDKLLLNVPYYSLSVSYNTMENSEYNNASGFLKDCYMLFNSDDDENCYYGKGINRSNNILDCLKVYDSSFLYECINCYESYNCTYLLNSKNCYNCDFGVDLINCKNCFGCTNLYGKEYYFFNKKLNKKDREIHIKKYSSNMESNNLRKKVCENIDFVKYSTINITENSTGDYLYEASNCNYCYDVEFISDSKYCTDLKKGDGESINNYDISQFGKGLSNCYEGTTIGYNVANCLFNVELWDNSNNCFYSVCCSANSRNLFGCVGLRNKEYCIFNIQYTKNEYEKLVPLIIKNMIQNGEWGEFFPSTLSQFGYNETEAQEYFPLTREQALEKGFNWSDYELPTPDVEKIIPANNLPNNIKDIPDDILNWAIECEITKKPFRIIKSELEFYRKHNISIPKKHPDERHIDRVKLRNPRKLYVRKCDKCNKEINTTYSSYSLKAIYCEECYNKEIG